jgi:multimeric flavodoxin WrbA
LRILAIEASARTDGLTAEMTRAALDGAEAAGAEAEYVHLGDLAIESCRMCDARGWGRCRTEGSCIIEDDFAGLVTKLRGADGFVFATPVYFGDLSESAKAFTDRLRRISTSEATRKFLGDMPTVGIAAAGGSGGGTPSCMASIEKVLSTPGCFVLDLVAVAQRNRHYKAEVMKAAGRGLVEYIAKKREG